MPSKGITMSYAGVLYGLGLQGVLSRLPQSIIGSLLYWSKEKLSMAVLLGLGVDKRGTGVCLVVFLD